MKLSLEFLGTGTSVGVPAIGCDCAVCASTDPRNKRLRSSVLVRSYDDSGANNTTVVIDTSPDFRQQMLRSNVRRVDAVVLTHFHADHVVGIDDIRRFNVMQQHVIDCWGTAETLDGMHKSFNYVFSEHLRWGWPCIRGKEFSIGAPFEIGALRFEPLELDHTIIKNAGLIITRSGAGERSIAYCLDVKIIPEKSLNALRGVDTLVLDMLREQPHPTHMTLAEALDVVKIVRPRRAFFGHMGHEVDHGPFEAKLPPEVRLAYDGLVLEV